MHLGLHIAPEFAYALARGANKTYIVYKPALLSARPNVLKSVLAVKPTDLDALIFANVTGADDVAATEYQVLSHMCMRAWVCV